MHRAVVGFFLAQCAFFDELRHQRLILAELGQGPLAQQIGPAVSYMRKPRFAVLKHQHGAGGAHAFALGMLGGVFENGAVRRGECVGQHLRDRAVDVVVQPADDVGRQRARDFARGMTAHPVGNQSKTAAAAALLVLGRRDPDHRVFVQRPHQPRIGAHGADDVQGTRRFSHGPTIHWGCRFPPGGGEPASRYYGEALRCGCSSSRT